MINDIAIFYQQEPELLFFFVFCFGACIGSFLNVVIYRLPIMLERQWSAEANEFLGNEIEQSQRFNLAVPHSSCPKCNSPITAWQNIPIISYAFLRGRCANCATGISIRYPFVELVTALLSVLLLYLYGADIKFWALLFFTYICIALIGIDFDKQLLPDNLTMPLLWVGLLLNTQSVFVSPVDAIIGAVAGYMSLWSVFWGFKLATGKEGMGYGDFKLMGVFGAWFGWEVLPNIILVSSFVGALLGGLLILLKLQRRDAPMPFGPFIAIAGWLTAIFPSTFIVMNYLK